MDFSDYLIYVKCQLASLDQFRVIRIVLGNESGDLDSTISACVYAYFLHLTCANRNEVLHLPIMNTKLSILRLRNEIRWFMTEKNFSNLLFIDDINLNELYDQKKLEIILVDHHYLHSKLNALVVEIIDHHRIKKGSIALQNSSAIRIEPVGSCCTLIAEKILSSNFQMTERIAYLLIGPIVFDTVNFSSSVGKATEKDQKIYDQLRTFLQSPLDDSELYLHLRESSCDTTGYSVEDLLQKDTKQLRGSNIRLIMSSLPINYTAEKLINELQNTNDLDKFLSKNENADGVIITSIEENMTPIQRQLGFYLKNSTHMQSLNDCIETNKQNLDLHERTLLTNHPRMKLFDQKDVHKSRKQLLPLFEECLVLSPK